MSTVGLAVTKVLEVIWSAWSHAEKYSLVPVKSIWVCEFDLIYIRCQFCRVKQEKIHPGLTRGGVKRTELGMGKKNAFWVWSGLDLSQGDSSQPTLCQATSMGEVLKFCRQMHHTPIHKPYSAIQLVHHYLNFSPQTTWNRRSRSLFIYLSLSPSIYLLMGVQRGK